MKQFEVKLSFYPTNLEVKIEMLIYLPFNHPKVCNICNWSSSITMKYCVVPAFAACIPLYDDLPNIVLQTGWLPSLLKVISDVKGNSMLYLIIFNHLDLFFNPVWFK